MIKISILI